jgi:predicted metal-dependent HD superfamily phosphohydrolase
MSNQHFDPKYISRNEFAQHWQSIGSQQSPLLLHQEQADSWLNRLWTLHTESTRHYHTARHLQEMWQYLNSVRQSLSLSTLQYDSLLFAIYFHDAIYNPQSSTNEADSAALWQACAADLHMSDSITTHVATMILATQSHRVPDHDENDPEAKTEAFVIQLLLDLDLAVLGKDEAAYDAYAAAIRREYAFVPTDEYCTKRASILQNMLDQSPRLFGNPIFFHTLEGRARNNLRREIAMLQRGEIIL